jgi:hypothetical protein
VIHDRDRLLTKVQALAFMRKGWHLVDATFVSGPGKRRFVVRHPEDMDAPILKVNAKAADAILVEMSADLTLCRKRESDPEWIRYFWVFAVDAGGT